MEHVRANWRSYLLALSVISPLKVVVVLLVTGALLRYLLHSVDKVDRTHVETSAHGR